MPADHPWTAKASIDSELLNDKSLLLLGEATASATRCWKPARPCARATRTSTPRWSPRRWRPSATPVASGLGVSVLPFSAVDSHHYAPGVIEVRPFSAPVPFRTVAIAWRASFPRPRAIEVLADSIRLCSVARPQTQEQPQIA